MGFSVRLRNTGKRINRKPIFVLSDLHIGIRQHPYREATASGFETQPYILEGVDIGKMIYDADAEITRELNSLRQSIEEAEEITRNAKADNPYEKAILDKISRVNFNDSEEEDIDIHSGIRIAKEEEDKA